jgi:protein-S-isoprenylcysteine O-methyltransferase Ste14
MHYPIQNVAYLIDFCWVVFALYWIIRIGGNKKSIYKRTFPFARIAVGFLVLVAAAIILKHLNDAPIIPYTKITQILGVALCAFGIGWAFWARNTLGANWSGNPTVKENHELIQTGPYAITRHPIYTGLVIAFLGTFLAVLPTWTGLTFMVLGIIGFCLKLRKEEQLMTQTFPEAYLVYKKRVPAALIPYIF